MDENGAHSAPCCAVWQGTVDEVGEWCGLRARQRTGKEAGGRTRTRALHGACGHNITRPPVQNNYHCNSHLRAPSPLTAASTLTNSNVRRSSVRRERFAHTTKTKRRCYAPGSLKPR